MLTLETPRCSFPGFLRQTCETVRRQAESVLRGLLRETVEDIRETRIGPRVRPPRPGGPPGGKQVLWIRSGALGDSLRTEGPERENAVLEGRVFADPGLLKKHSGRDFDYAAFHESKTPFMRPALERSLEQRKPLEAIMKLAFGKGTPHAR